MRVGTGKHHYIKISRLTIIVSYLFVGISLVNALSILNPNKTKPPIPISEEIGTSPTFNYEYFDPLNLANEFNFAIYREAELKHGRIAMLAVLGNTLPDIFRDQITPPASVYLSPSNELHFREVPSGLKALITVPLMGWLQILLFIGFFETQVFIQRDKKDLPGDYGLGYFGVRDKANHWRSLESELENGRLAMVAFVIQVIYELITGNTVGSQLIQGEVASKIIDSVEQII